MTGTFGTLWLVFGLAGALGAFGWPKSAWMGAVGVALGALMVAMILDDDPLDFPAILLINVLGAFSLFVGLQVYGLRERRRRSHLRE